MSNLPTSPGFYWAKWRVSDDGVPAEWDVTPSNVWQVVEVDLSYCDDRDELMAEMPGVPGQHTLEGFAWRQTDGAVRPLPPPASPLTDYAAQEAERAKAAYLAYKRMTPDQRVALLQRRRLTNQQRRD